MPHCTCALELWLSSLWSYKSSIFWACGNLLSVYFELGTLVGEGVVSAEVGFLGKVYPLDAVNLLVRCSLNGQARLRDGQRQVQCEPGWRLVLS